MKNICERLLLSTPGELLMGNVLHLFNLKMQNISLCLGPGKYTNSSNEMHRTNVLAGKTMFKSLIFQEIG